MKVIICHKFHPDVDRLFQLNEAAGHDIFTDEEGYLYVRILEEGNVFRKEDSAPKDSPKIVSF